MKIDRYYDPYEDLEREIIADLEYAAQRIGGKMERITRVDSRGRSSKVITIEYDVNEPG
tara:strand:+ start:21276 stop:21452 length:177 start_codon:yes stop_codon:yes gene_type:complete